MLIPTGRRTFLNDQTGTPAGVLGAGDMPVNFRGDDGAWSPIELRWDAVTPTRWRAVHGNHRVIVDSTLGVQFSKRDVLGTWHRLGMQPRKLVKFNIANKTWDALATSASPLVSITGGIFTMFDVFPDVHCELDYFNDSFTLRWVFTQAARDALVSEGPWPGHAIGIATELDLSQLSANWRDTAGEFGVDTDGRLSDLQVDVHVDGATVFALPSESLQYQGVNPFQPGIKVRKFFVVRGGIPYLVELFDAVAASALPTGDIWHHATFGESGTPGAALLGCGNAINSNTDAPASDGTGDRITCFHRATNGAKSEYTVHVTCALYTDGSPSTYLQETEEKAWGPGGCPWGWHAYDFDTQPSLTNGVDYNIALWSELVSANDAEAKVDVSGGANKYDAVETYSTPLSWPDLSSSNALNMYIYCTYTEASGGPPVGTLASCGAGR